ncbi:hypothetical protein CBW65_10435 [Tumebacillus avium]|uniref:Uncharacterized protein n=1 Tax=Tumebacillus avium TaxID=1903704 RepID=A0A1Y0IM64_9BACL|nr:hypothetical protein [Tumebacillus avium]ARU61370.1 hypothetical protein CBW65_10435 [Tumebacillus avium]
MKQIEEALITMYQIAPQTAKQLVTDSWFSKLFAEDPDSVLSQSPNYWADDIQEHYFSSKEQ